jgi:enoyl-CoA hydratase
VSSGGGSELVKQECHDGVVLLTLDRPDKLNAISAAMLDQLNEALIELEDDDGVGAIVLTGSPAARRPAFAAGADIAEMAAMGPLELRSHAHLGQTACSLIESMPKPVIAAVNGVALGGGCELAMACHFRFAGRSALFGQPEINLGIIPGFGGTQRLVRLIGKGPALEWLLTGESAGAEEALRLGLVNRVLEDQVLVPATLEVARKMAGKAPLARRLILDAVARGSGMELDAATSLEADLFGLAGATADVREGLQAFLEKRAPRWQGR